MAADLLTTIRSELDARLGELRPLLSEYERLVAAVQALELQAAQGSSEAASERASSSAVEVPAKPPAPARRPGRPRGSAAGAIRRAASAPEDGQLGTPSQIEIESHPEPLAEEESTPSAEAGAGKRERAPKGAARQAILAALEHGSHTVSELAVVTAMSGPNINGNIRRLLQERKIAKTPREGKTAYALVGSGS